MINPAEVVSIHPYFKVRSGNLEAVRGLLKQMVDKTSTEKANLYYDFTLNHDILFCREAYLGADGLLAHVENIAPALAELLKLVDIVRVEVHGSKTELQALKGPLAGLSPEWFEFEAGVVKPG